MLIPILVYVPNCKTLPLQVSSCLTKVRGVNGGTVYKSANPCRPFFRKICQSADIFVQIGNHNQIQKQKCKSSEANW